MSENLFSVVIPVYNRANAIGRAIKSVLAQTYSHFELLIIDNCSTDNTVEVVETFKDHRICIIRNEQNVGLWPNHNKGAIHASGIWLIFLHSDEELLPDCLANVAFALKQLKPADASKVGLIAGISSKSPISTFSLSSAFANQQSYPATVLTVLNGISQPSGIVINKAAFTSAGGFTGERELYFHADHALYLNLALRRCDFLFITKELTSWEDHADRAINKVNDSQKKASFRMFCRLLQTGKGMDPAIPSTFDNEIDRIPALVRFRIVLALAASGLDTFEISTFIRRTFGLSIRQRGILINHYVLGLARSATSLPKVEGPLK